MTNVLNLRVPAAIKERISNANYYLNASQLIPLRAFDAAKISFLLTAWENIQTAEEELSAWVRGSKPAKALYKSHAYKFRNVRASKSIDRLVVNSARKIDTTSYASDTEFAKLLELCRYGFSSGSKDVAKIFATGWFFDAFENALVSKIRWEEAAVRMFESLPKSEQNGIGN